MGYQLIKEDKHSFVVKHPEGHEITIAKAGLDARVMKKITGMQPVKMSDGGEVPQEGLTGLSDTTGVPQSDLAATPTPIPMTLDTSQGIMAPSSAQPGPVPAPGPLAAPLPSPEMVGPPAPTPQAGPTPSRSPASLPTLNPYGDLDPDKLARTMTGAYNTIGRADKQEHDANARALQFAQQASQDENTRFQQQSQKLETELNANREAYMTGKIDPNRLWNTAGTGNKLSAAVGLILSGMGSGLTGQPNLALNVIDKAIDRDIDSQKANLDKQKSLYSMNLERYHDARAAHLATKAELWNAASAQMQINAQKSGSQKSMAAAQLAGAQVQQAIMPMKVELNKLKMVKDLQGRSDPQSQALMVRLAVPEKQQEQAYKELATAENHAKQTSTIMASFDQANKENTLGNRAIHAGYEPASVSRMKTAMLPYLKDAEGRINEQELERTDALIPRPGDSASKIQEKRLGMQQFLQEKASFPTLRAYGIRVPELFNSSGGSTIQEHPAVK